MKKYITFIFVLFQLNLLLGTKVFASNENVEIDNMMSSPNTTCIYIEDSGYYRIDIILNNFDAYYGYFTVHDGILI